MENKWFKLFPDATENKVEFLIDGKETFESIVKAIQTAKTIGDYIYILGWMLDIDFPLIQGNRSTTLFNLLRSAAEKGVEVRILIWDNWFYRKDIWERIQRLNKILNIEAFIDNYTYSSPKSEAFLSKYTSQVIEYLSRLFVQSALEKLDLGKYIDDILEFCHKKNVGSHHDKVVIVRGEDGLIAFCGGLDINRNRFDEFHDTHCKVQGPAAHQILQRFVMRWKNNDLTATSHLSGESESEYKRDYPYMNQLAKVVGTYNDRNSIYKDHSLKNVYLKIISNAEKYIYIEDQYLVNLDVAEKLNKTLRKPNFSYLILVTQDEKLTWELLVPNKKRMEFMNILRSGLTKRELDKIHLLIIEEEAAKKGGYHPGIHSKTLIVDDEIAIIGSANVNHRSFTHDSETSVIVFDETWEKDTFAKRLLISILREYSMYQLPVNSVIYRNLGVFLNLYVYSCRTMLRKYINRRKDIDDETFKQLDRLYSMSWPMEVAVEFVPPSAGPLGRGARRAVVARELLFHLPPTLRGPFSENTIRSIFSYLYEYIVDPKVEK